MVETMTIVDCNTQHAFDEVLKGMALSEQGNPNVDEKVWLRVNLGSDSFGVWLAYQPKDGADEIRGILTVELITIEGEYKGYIPHYWFNGGPEGYNQLLEPAVQWAKNRNLSGLLHYTKLNPKYFIKRQGFQLIHTVIELPIGE